MAIDKQYHSYNGTKLEYSEDSGSTYKELKGLLSFDDIGGEPNEINTTDLGNTEYETAMYGLKPVQKYNFEFNMQDPSVEANIYEANRLETLGTPIKWKLTYSNGIEVKFDSEVRTTLKGGSSGDLIGFTLHLAPKEEVEITIPTTSL